MALVPKGLIKGLGVTFKELTKTIVDGAVIGVAETCVVRVTRAQVFAAERLRDVARARAGQPQHTDAGSPGGGGDGGDGVGHSGGPRSGSGRSILAAQCGTFRPGNRRPPSGTCR